MTPPRHKLSYLTLLILVGCVCIGADTQSNSTRTVLPAKIETLGQARLVIVLRSGHTEEFVFIVRNGTLSRIVDDFERVDSAKTTRQYSYQFGSPIQNGKLTVDLREVALVQMDDL
jgi:hypothetical protein